MNSPQCDNIRCLFSAYLDGAVDGVQMQSISGHLENCEDCREEFASLREMQNALASLGPTRAPADLGTRLRVAISHEIATRNHSWRDTLALCWENTIRPWAVQISAGAACSVALVGTIMVLLGLFAAPQAVMANDEPLGAMTSAHYLYSAVMPRPIVTSHDSAIIVEAFVNDQGRVYDYHIVSGPEDSSVRSQVIDQLLLSVFEPARVFGTPVRSRVVMTFSGISVEG
ncbi:anti-sigma factor [Edaphobacter albus]|uniref:anti-sigma factor n=1 Tax=Edaphobacter sp. 4G125 TaxID=2763071 RepID=UPI0016464C66|nr:anti-sigma factor [Edaphobacter sp. 4G125]QNI37461.1 zf-HC2 domain-containing protein [Edaphobacter sp. 4G125]